MNTQQARTRTHTVVDSPLGELILVAENGALAGLYMDQHRPKPKPESFGQRDDVGFEAVQAQLAEYFAGSRRSFDLPLAVVGDDFQLKVWALVAQIPYGHTRSYGQIARELGNPSLARKVGGANARNPLSVVVPCHRVIGSDGKLVGYGGGLERKRLLLDLESAQVFSELSRT